jgi:parallel beta-helix repeat protein
MKTVSVILAVMSLSTICLGRLPADLDNDGTVDFCDLAVFSREWLGSEFGVESNSPVYTVAASDTPESVKATADYVCDGIDDQIEIQSAIAALPNGGGKVLLLGGRYNVRRTAEHYCIGLRSRTTLEGLGWGTVIYLVDNADATVVRGYEVEKAVVRDLAIDGNKHHQTPVPDPNRSNFPDMWTNGINLRDSNDCLISNVYVKDTLMHGINIWERSCRNIVENCLVENIGRHIPDDYYATASILIFKYSDENIVKNCRCEGPLMDSPGSPRGLYVSYHCAGNLIDGNVLRNFRGARGGGGVVFLHSTSRRNKFINNDVNDCDYGIRSSTTDLPGTCNIIAGNRFENCSRDGIAVREGQKWIITDNVIDNAVRGLVIGDMNDVLVSGNQVIAQHDGVFLQDLNNNMQISGNMIDSTGYGIYIYRGDSQDSPKDIIITNNNIKSIWAGVGGYTQAISRIADNVGYTTENSGAAVIDAESTFVLVEHGLDLTPIDGDVVVVPTNSMGNSTKFYVGSYGATQFRITVDQAPGAETAAFAWRAEIRR